jgi:4-amino-4-deoxy-L-arabinose transferase-like glycosyltransferase
VLSPTDRAGLIAVVLLSAATHFAYLACSSNYYFPDSATYMSSAKTLSEGYGFGENAETPETMRTPGYPLLLAAFDLMTPNPFPVVLTQHLLACLLTAALYLLALRETGSRRIAVVASIILALDTLTIHYANKVLTENLFTIVLFGVVLLALRLSRMPSASGFVLLGLLSGALVMIRPVAIAYAAVLALFFAVAAPATHAPGRASMIKAIAAFLAAALLIPIGWGLRNQRETGVFTIASIAGTNMLLYRAAGVLAIADAGDFTNNLKRRQAQLEGPVRSAIRKSEGVEPDELPHAVLARWYSRAASPVILAHPGAYVLLAARGVACNLFETEWAALAVVSRLPPALIEWVMRALTLSLFPVAISGLIILGKRNRNLATLIALTCAYYLVVSAGGESEARFRVPIVPFYALAAAAGFDRFMKRRPQHLRP